MYSREITYKRVACEYLIATQALTFDLNAPGYQLTNNLPSAIRDNGLSAVVIKIFLSRSSPPRSYLALQRPRLPTLVHIIMRAQSEYVHVRINESG